MNQITSDLGKENYTELKKSCSEYREVEQRFIIEPIF